MDAITGQSAVQQPLGLTLSLRPYQRRAVTWMLHRERANSENPDASVQWIRHPGWQPWRVSTGPTTAQGTSRAR